jgi:amino acid adenylation domain-containing protein
MISRFNESVAHSIKKWASKPCLIEPDGSTWTYSDIHGYIERISETIRRNESFEKRKVALVLPKSAHSVACILAALSEGMPYIPIDSTAPMDRAIAILRSSNTSLVFVQTDQLDIWQEAFDAQLETFHVKDSPLLLIRIPMEEDDSEQFIDNLAYILFTSGSTGSPKGVQITYENAWAFVDWAISALVPEENMVFSSIAPFHFDLSVFDLFATLITGGCLVLFDDKLIKNPRMLAQIMSEKKISIVYATPTLLRLLLQYGKLERYNWKSLKVILFAGEVFQIPPLRELTELWPNVSWFNLYGPTETNVVTYFPISLPIAADRNEPFPIGKTCSGAKYILRTDTGEMLSAGEGELLISGPTVTPGYFGRPEHTPFVIYEGDTWYATGDWVKADDSGTITFSGRKDRMVKRRGYRIELGEVESAYSQIEGINTVIAFSLDKDGERIIVAVLQMKENMTLPLLELKELGLQYLPPYMLPDHFLKLDEWPMTSSQKIDYKSIEELIRKTFIADN